MHANMKPLCELLGSHEEWLMQRVLDYGRQQNYTRDTSPLIEDWRVSIQGLTTTITAACVTHDAPPELGPDEDYVNDPIAVFGIMEARRHRERGVTLAMFLGLLKYYRQAYVDLLAEADLPDGQRARYRPFIERLFDRVEIGFCQEWANVTRDDRLTELQTANRRITNELRRSNAELEQFAYVASHNLQEPLRKITAFGDILKQSAGHALEAEGRDSLKRMLNAAVRMRKLIQSLHVYTRATTRHVPHETLDTDAILETVCSDLDVQIAETGARVERAPLPAIKGDAILIRQLLQNLLNNALTFRQAGRAPVIRIRSITGDGVPRGMARFEVTDNGIGFDMKYHDRIFKVFERLHARSSYEGTGIGLAVCNKIVQRHGGTIAATSQPDEGTTFTIDLPLPGAADKD